MKIRYAITHWSSTNLYRTLTFSTDYHFETREEAEEALESYMGPDGLCKILTPKQMDSLEVTEIECYDNGDSIRTVF